MSRAWLVAPRSCSLASGIAEAAADLGVTISFTATGVTVTYERPYSKWPTNTTLALTGLDGDRFAGVPLSSALRYRCVMELTGAVETFASHGAAWEAHGARAVPRSLGAIRSAAEAQRFYERSFYDGRVLVDAPVLAIPVAVVRWVEGDR